MKNRLSDWWALWLGKQNANWIMLSLYSLNCSIFWAKKFKKESTTQKTKRTWKMAVTFHLHINVRKEKNDLQLNPNKNKNCVCKTLTESQQQPILNLCNWLQNKHIITLPKIYNNILFWGRFIVNDIQLLCDVQIKPPLYLTSRIVILHIVIFAVCVYSLY